MADEEDDEQPSVELGEGPVVDGAPVARVASRLSWPRSIDAIEEQAGDVEIRTADGPTRLDAILEDVDTSYFGTRREFVSAVREVIGYGPVATAE